MSVLNVTDAEFNEVLKKHKDVIVKYYTDWCGACRMFSPIYEKLSEDKRYKNIKFLEVNMEHDPGARSKAAIDFIPYLATFQNGEFYEGHATTQEKVVVTMLEELVHHEVEQY